MNKSNHLSIDGRLLSTFLVVLETGSATKSAEHLGVTQSSVSHSLRRLRTFFGDPLFVRSGQMFLPTERAISLKKPIQNILDGMEGLTHERSFCPVQEELFFIVAANDMQRELVFPQLIRELDAEGVSIYFEFIPSGHPSLSMMRDARCHLALTPFPPDSTDIVQKQVFEGSMMCFFDGEVRDPPENWEEYCKAEHVTVRFPDGGTSQRALTGIDKSGIQRPKIAVPNFGAIPSFVKGTRMIATEMDLMKLCTLKELDMAPLHRTSDPVKIFLSWHRRSDSEPAHAWLRTRIQQIASRLPS